MKAKTTRSWKRVSKRSHFALGRRPPETRLQARGLPASARRLLRPQAVTAARQPAASAAQASHRWAGRRQSARRPGRPSGRGATDTREAAAQHVPGTSRPAGRYRALAATAAAAARARTTTRPQRRRRRRRLRRRHHRHSHHRRRALLDPEVHEAGFRGPPTPPVGGNHWDQGGEERPEVEERAAP